MEFQSISDAYFEPFFQNLPSTLKGPTLEVSPEERYQTRKYTNGEKKNLSQKAQQLQLSEERHLELLVGALERYQRRPVKVS